MILDEIINKITSFKGDFPSAILMNENMYNEMIDLLRNDVTYTYPSNSGVKLHIAGVQVYRTNDVETFKVI